VSKELLFSYAGLFQLKEELLENLERMGSKSAGNIVRAIEDSKRITLNRFIYALGIRHVGEHVAGILARSFESLEKLIDTTKEELEAIDGVGPVVAQSIVVFFKKDENRKIVIKIIDSGVRIFRDNAHKQGVLAGKVFVLTGSLATLTRDEAKKVIEDAGGKVTGTVSRNTDYLVIGASPGSKLKRAEELGVDIIDEQTLKGLLIED